MEYPHRGFGSGEEEHHHQHHFPHRPPPQSEEEFAYGADGYPPAFPHHHAEAPHAHSTHTQYSPPGPNYGTQPSSGPYGTHPSSGPYYPHPHDHGSSHETGYHGSSHETGYPSGPPHHAQELLPQGQIMRVFCKASPDFNLAVEHDTVIMKPADSQDESQLWIKDSSYGLRVKDNYGFPAFSLVNKKTRKLLKHHKHKGQQVLLMDYRPDIKDDDILWSESQDFGEGFKTVRSASDTLLNLTVFEGAKKIRNGSALVLDTWHKADHQYWKLFPL